jgi:hypothetical protein
MSSEEAPQSSTSTNTSEFRHIFPNGKFLLHSHRLQHSITNMVSLTLLINKLWSLVRSSDDRNMPSYPANVREIPFWAAAVEHPRVLDGRDGLQIWRMPAITLNKLSRHATSCGPPASDWPESLKPPHCKQFSITGNVTGLHGRIPWSAPNNRKCYEKNEECI